MWNKEIIGMVMHPTKKIRFIFVAEQDSTPTKGKRVKKDPFLEFPLFNFGY